MPVISAEQFETMEAQFALSRRRKLAADFVRQYPGFTKGVSEEQLVAYIDVVIADSVPSDGKSDEEIVEFAALGIVCLGLIHEPDRVALVQRVVEDDASSPRERLDFIWTRLLPEYAHDRGLSARPLPA